MTSDAKHIAVQFNECINNRDLDGLSRLMTDDHAFIDRNGAISRTKKVMIESWRKFFELCPGYRNTFERVESEGDLVFILGYAYWSEKQPHDPVIWTAAIAGELVHEWRIYEDTTDNRKRFKLNSPLEGIP